MYFLIQKPIRCYCGRLTYKNGIYIIFGKLFNKNTIIIHYLKPKQIYQNCKFPSKLGKLK